jgi:hypothetical protein
MGPLEVGEQSRQELLTYAQEGGRLDWANAAQAEERVGQMLQLIVATREYQFN